MLETVPSDPNRVEYRQGNTMGTAFRHWRRVKIGRRFRLFFRFDTKTKLIIFARVNDENTLRSSASKSDPYAVFQKMFKRGQARCIRGSMSSVELISLNVAPIATIF